MAVTPATTLPEDHVPTRPAPLPRPSIWKMFWGGIGFALFLLIVGLVSLWYFSGAENGFVDPDAKRVEYRQKVYADRVAEDDKYLKDQPGWFDQKKGLVRVPIQEAIDMTIPKLLADKPHPAYALKDSPPQPAAAPTGPAMMTTVAAGNNAANPPASNPTVGQPGPAPVAAAPAPQQPVAKSSPVPVAPSTAPAGAASPAPAVPPSIGPTPTPVPEAGATPFPTQTPNTSTSGQPSNNVNNPGNPPIPGTTAEKSSPSVAPATASPQPTATPNPTASESKSNPAVQSSPAGNNQSPGSTPTPDPHEPGVIPGGTPR